MIERSPSMLADTGERMIPPREGEISLVWSRHRFAYEYAVAFAASKRVLDVGCGTGYGTQLLARQARSVVGIDYDASAIAYCRSNFQAPNIEYRVADVAGFRTSERFDCIVSFQVIEHLQDPAEFLSSLRSLLADRGTILITTPNVRDAGRPSDNPFHLSEMDEAAMRNVASKVFDRFELLGIGYARPNLLRRVLQRTPLFWLGRFLRRSSAIKRAAAHSLDLQAFAIVHENLERDAIDLLLVGHND